MLFLPLDSLGLQFKIARRPWTTPKTQDLNLTFHYFLIHFLRFWRNSRFHENFAKILQNFANLKKSLSNSAFYLVFDQRRSRPWTTPKTQDLNITFHYFFIDFLRFWRNSKFHENFAKILQNFANLNKSLSNSAFYLVFDQRRKKSAVDYP